MHSLLEKPALRENLARLSVESYHQVAEFTPAGRRTEFLQGLVFEKMSKSPKHVRLMGLLLDYLFSLKLPGIFLNAEQPLRLGDSEPEPDIALIRGKREDFAEEHPRTAELVIEVAHTSLEYDRAKASVYAAGGVPRYLIFNINDAVVEEYSRPDKETQAYAMQRHFRGQEALEIYSGASILPADFF